MKKSSFSLPELFYIFAFLLYLVGSSITHILNGVEISLWLMAFAMVTTISTTILPWLGIQWLTLEKKGCRAGWWLALLLQVASWGTYAFAMFLRLNRNLPRFHTLITLTTLLWAAWLLIFIYSRYACQPQHSDDKLGDETAHPIVLDEKREE